MASKVGHGMMQSAEKQGAAVVTASVTIATSTAPAAADESEQPVIDVDSADNGREEPADEHAQAAEVEEAPADDESAARTR
jgi:hypothetical protein